MLGQRHFGCGRMDTLMLAVQFARQRDDRRTQPPVPQFAQQAAVAGLAVDLGDRALHDRDVAAVAVDEIEAPEAVLRQRCDAIAEHGEQRRRPERHRAGKAHVMLRHADRQHRRDQPSGRVADAARDCIGADRVGADQSIRAMLFGRADRQHDAGAVTKIRFDLGPCAGGELHRRRVVAGDAVVQRRKTARA